MSELIEDKYTVNEFKLKEAVRKNATVTMVFIRLCFIC